MAQVILLRQREKSLLRRHPWIFSGAIDRVDGSPGPGDTVDLLDARGEWLARGAFSPESQITVRVWTFDRAEEINPEFFRVRLDRSIQARAPLLKSGAITACRLVNAESDSLPGLIVDKYADFLVCQFLTVGAERWRREIVDQLGSLLSPAGIYERSDMDVRKKEGLESAAGLIAGAEPPDLVDIREYQSRYLVDIRQGQKTGFYLDQRDNRALVGAWSAGAEVLNCFSYTAGFTIPALVGGAARVTNVDSSGPSLALGRRNVELNGLDTARVEDVEGDVFQLLRKFRDSRRQFDVIVLDPPKFADSRGHIEKACRGYKDINILGFKLLKPGGTLFTFSCSGLISTELFQQIVAGAALDARQPARIVRHLSQAPDHPIALPFPEGAYLKGLACQV